MKENLRMKRVTEIKNYLKDMLKDAAYEISHANNDPMYVNCRVRGGVLACDIALDNDKVKTDFFWRSEDTIKKPSDAKLHSIEYFASVVLPRGYSVCNKGEKEGYRWEKIYGDGYSTEEIAKEITYVFNSFGLVEER